MSFYDMVPLGFGVGFPRPQYQRTGTVQFMLRYNGLLPSNGSTDDKQRVRMQISKQLEELCRRNEFFNECLSQDLLPGTYSAGKLTFHHDVNHPGDRIAFCRVRVGGFDFVPLIHREYYLACQLDITWLRREKPGDIVKPGGDLDNRLKTLFDGLRMPHRDDEVGSERPAADGQRVYCLLDDDSLITKLSVATYQLLEPPDGMDATKGEHVDLLLHVTVQVTSRRFGNVNVGELIA